ncbi:helix-turn-helix domain-containing protein [Dactylosporangium sp. NPDC049525]|uniref:helix-turn-helix domain-containing protein n=1 Tax=Dactylosporangium sp. NPDC049525 TaxID=3154730 RepID=UPI003431B54F
MTSRAIGLGNGPSLDRLALAGGERDQRWAGMVPALGRPQLVAPVGGFAAFVFALVLDEHMPTRLTRLADRVERGQLHQSRIGEVREMWANVRAAAEDWKQNQAASAGGSREARPAEMRPDLTQEIDTATAARLLHVTESRVRQLVRSGEVAARKVGGVWLVSRSEIEMRRTAA